ncbi:MAG TPA: hypothetical protein VGN80_01090 [Devosiaceae bacterium]|jgi:hypothetical protein|nr:hypothetical protein [Devosiaceae bacterium]
MFSPNDLRLPSLGLLRRYLTISGWRRTLLPRGDLELFTQTLGGAVVEIVLPSSSSAATAAERIIPALNTLASIGSRSVKDVAAEVAMLDFDIIRARLPDSMVLRESIPLRIAERFIGNSRRFLASASAAEKSRELLMEDAQKSGADYANGCRFGHTFQGSFGFTIESPAGPAPNLAEGETSPPPFERRVVERIARGIQAIERSYTTGDPEVLERGVAAGLNINMLEDFTSLVADSTASKITFSFVLTPAWAPSYQLPSATEISQDVLPLIDRVVSSLRPPIKPVTETIIGQVIMLHTREIPTDLLHEGTREIAIEGISIQRGPLTVKVRLSAADYLLALAAHGTGKPVSVTGMVTRSSRGNALTNISGFKEA